MLRGWLLRWPKLQMIDCKVRSQRQTHELRKIKESLKHMNAILRLTLTALSISLFLSACATTETAEERALAAAERQGELNAQRYPDLPEDCRARELSGVRQGDRLDVALIRTDRALGRANERVARCADWYDDFTRERANFDR